ncbi:MAG TPA: hypothetical protein VH253_04780 [Phycisphaerae bacterium]|nr:hypothetical protein [Phycisphaerae bacterium]
MADFHKMVLFGVVSSDQKHTGGALETPKRPLRLIFRSGGIGAFEKSRGGEDVNGERR